MANHQLPVTVPPKRNADPPTMAAQFLSKLQTSESCKNSPCSRKKLEPKYNFQLHLGSHSAQASPLPHRRLDKLHGVIHDKQPSFVHLNECVAMSPDLKRRHTECHVRPYPDQMMGSPFLPRRRLDSDCSCSPIHRAVSVQKSCDCAGSSSGGGSKLSEKNLGQFDCENSRKSMKNEQCSELEAGGASVHQQQSACIYSRVNEMENCSSESKLSEDKTIISGWLKFRDNKKWKIRWGVITKISPAADCLHLQLYRDSKEWYKNGPTKASLSLQHFLGIETGFTLDKESNTIAILCQDVIVVLAFDTREKLIQWQAKITNTLGDDIQYLILVSSTPPKAKVTTGPARLHIQDQRFCLTTGVPPKLTGLWSIGHLRRYGVVDGRFCFEGGSACGKGEGLYIFITDVGEEITQTIKLAAQGQLALKKRPLVQKGATLGRADTISYIGDESGTMNHDVTDCGFGTQYWPSQESRDLDSNYGCGDTASVSERHNVINDLDPFGRFSKLNPERCMSCISKIGALSRSSTVNGADVTDQSSVMAWTITEENKAYHSKTSTLKFTTPFVDKMSTSTHSTKKNQSMQHLLAGCEGHLLTCGSRKAKSPHGFVGSYENYDIPKNTIMSNAGVLYDTPKKMQELHLQRDLQTSTINKYGNYDKPLMVPGVKNTCQCTSDTAESNEKENEQARTNCTCNRVMSWADNWIPFPYCKRGNGIENTGPRLPAKESSLAKGSTIDTRLYATIDLTKKIRKQYQDCNCSCDDGSSNEPKLELKTSKSTTNIPNCTKPMANYVNLTYGSTAENYENSDVVLIKAKDGNMCLKCGHASKVQTTQPKSRLDPEGNYAIMNSSNKVKNDFTGYTPMSPPTALTVEPEPTGGTPAVIVQIPTSNTSTECSTTPTAEENLPNRKFNTIGSVKCLQSTKDSPAGSSVGDRKADSSLTALNNCSFDSILLRRSTSVPCKTQNRDSSSSNDSGVSTSSIRYRKIDLSDYEEISVGKRWPGLVSSTNSSCIHASLIRKHKFNKDPMQCLSFEFQKTPSEKSNSCKTEPADIHMYHKQKSSESPSENTSMAGPTFIDSRSTSSGTSDMSDYIETLSLSSHSSSETAEGLRRQITSKLRPRFGKEYQNIDRLLSMNTQNLDSKNSCHSFLNNYANITPVLELVNAESPSPGYQSGTSPQDGRKDSFMFKNA